MRDSEGRYGGTRKYKVKGKKSSENKHIDDSVLYQAFVSTFNAIVGNRDYFIKKWRTELKSENVLFRYKAEEFIRII